MKSVYYPLLISALPSFSFAHVGDHTSVQSFEAVYHALMSPSHFVAASAIVFVVVGGVSIASKIKSRLVSDRVK